MSYITTCRYLPVTSRIVQLHPITDYRTVLGFVLFWFWVSWCVVFANSSLLCYVIMMVAAIIGIFMAILLILIYSFGFSVTSSSGSADTHLPNISLPGHSQEYCSEYVTFGLLYVMFRLSSRIFYRGLLYFATDCPCGVWCRGLNTCLLYVGPLFGNLVWNDIGFVSLTYWRKFFSLFDCISTYILVPQNMIMLYMHLPYFQVSEFICI